MALRALMLRKQIDDKQKELAQLREKDAEFERREAELETSIEEAQTDEEKAAVSEAVETFEAEKTEHEEARASVERAVSELESELQEIEAEAKKAPPEEKRNEVKKHMETRAFFNLPPERRDAFFARQDVKDFLQRARDMGAQKRSVTGGELLIPEVVLELIRENVIRWSKLYDRVNVKQVPGKARQLIMGAIPEGIWTEMCATMNELEISFSAVEVDGYKVGGVIILCNALLADSDIALATEIISALGQSIGLALDKAILYGTGTKMPLGILPRLAQSSAPSDYPATAPAWKNLSTSNIITITGKTDVALFKALAEASGAAKGKYSRGQKFWAMSEATYTKLISNAMSINAAGAIVTGVNGEMPVIGGPIDVLDFIPDDVIIGGYGDLYLLAERQGATIAQSEHARFIEDQTAFRGVARYDGKPVIAEGFVAIGINGNTPSADAVTFAGDDANNALLDSLALSGQTLSPVFASGTFAYTCTASGTSCTVEAVPQEADAQVAIVYNGKPAANGGTISLASGTKNLTVTVKKGSRTLTYTVAITKS